MKLLFAGYRDWALKTFARLQDLVGDQHHLMLVSDQRKLKIRATAVRWDAIALVGWSWIVPNDIIENTYTVCVHPSDLPQYAGGSPLQHQIIAGLTETKNTLFRVTDKIDAGPIIDQCTMSLEGTVKDVFWELERSSSVLLHRFVTSWPNVEETPQPEDRPTPFKRRKPDMSRLTPYDFRVMTARQLYDFMRCLGDPYPNAYIEDGSGRLLFKQVEFESREDK